MSSSSTKDDGLVFEEEEDDEDQHHHHHHNSIQQQAPPPQTQQQPVKEYAAIAGTNIPSQDHHEPQQQPQQEGNAVNEQQEDENAPAQEAPYWACKYCGIDEPASVVRCIESGFWFCNYAGKTSAAHIVHHLVRSKNKEICLHPESPLGETIVECYNCSNRNVFLMGFIRAKGENVVVLLCRTCLGQGELKQLGWNTEAWEPLIQDRQLESWLVKVPEDSEFPQAEAISTKEINHMEDVWKRSPNADVADLQEAYDEPDPVCLSYEDGFHFQRIYSPLVLLEAEYDREMKGQMREDNVSLKWKVSEVSGRITALVTFSVALTEALRLTIGDELKLTLDKHLVGDISANINKEALISGGVDQPKKGRNRRAQTTNSRKKKDWSCVGTVVNIHEDGQISLDLRTKDSVPLHVEHGYSLEFVWKPVTFDRMQVALKRFASDDQSVSGYLYHKLLGHAVEDQILTPDLPHRLSVRGLPELNESQSEAIRQVLRKPLALIQGPPGTGKTVTSASLVFHMVRQSKGEAVLVTAPSNVAVDQLTEKLNMAGLRVIRIAAKSREHLESTVEHLTLHHIISKTESGASNQIKELLAKKEENGNSLNAADAKKLLKLRRQLERQVIQAADVVCCTCSGAGDPRLAGKRFKYVLLDEATQATEPESLIPIVMGCHQFVLVGDHCQLGPVVMCKKAANAGLNTSLFERLVTLGLRPIRLTIQYRMHPCLSDFPSNTFYEGSLMNGVSAEQRQLQVEFPWPDPKKPMMFYASDGSREELAGTGTSYLNRTEAANCERVVTQLLRGGATPDQIGVVTPYEGQRAYIVTHMQRSGPLRLQLYKDIEVSSVDAFQGREKDFIILSCVRSNEKSGIGFLQDPRRLNVALTRAKYGTIVLGDAKVLAKKPLWNELLTHFRDEGLLVDGPLNNLKVSQMKFPKAKKYYRDRRQRAFDESAARVFSGDINDPYGERSTKKQAPVLDSRHDPRYGGERHVDPYAAQQAVTGFFQPGPMIPMPNIYSYQQGAGDVQSGYDLQQQQQQVPPPFKGYGDYDYYDPKDDAAAGNGLETQDMSSKETQQYTQDSSMPQPHTQVGGFMASQSQLYTQQPASQSQLNTQSNSQYQFQDEDDDE